MLTANTVLQERYRIIRPLGQGGMGAVYEAVDERLGKTIAIKEILLVLANSANEKQKELVKTAFRREADSLVKAKHDAVPDVTDYFSEMDRQFLVMEYIEGDDLAKMLQTRQKPFLLEEVMPWIDQLLEALDYLHHLEPPIIHRDIKPQNLKLNVWKKIKLLDFGIAKSTDQSSTITHQTFIGATLNYSPIEQILRVIDPTFREFIILKHQENAKRVLAQNTDARCDIFALGATFYHLLTNYPPIDITKRTLETWEGKADPLPTPSQLNPAVSPPISAWLIKAMAIERDDRFSSAVEMRKALHTALNQENLQKQKDKQAQAIEQENLRRKEEEERKLRERISMEAKTENFVVNTEDIPSDTAGEIPLKTQPSYPEIANIPMSGTQSSTENPTTESSVPDVFVTQAAENITQPRANRPAQFTGGFQSEDKSTPTFSSKPETTSGSGNLKFLLLIPIFAVVLLAIGGIGGLAWWYGTGTTDSESSSATNVQASPSPENSPESLKTAGGSSADNSNQTDDIDEEIPPTPEASEVPSEVQNTPQTRPTAKPTVRPTQKQTPVQTRTPVKPTPAKTKDQDCIYTNDCK